MQKRQRHQLTKISQIGSQAYNFYINFILKQNIDKFDMDRPKKKFKISE
jgi:hypothetical protein